MSVTEVVEAKFLHIYRIVLAAQSREVFAVPFIDALIAQTVDDPQYPPTLNFLVISALEPHPVARKRMSIERIAARIDDNFIEPRKELLLIFDLLSLSLETIRVIWPIRHG
jgi:hypothetical protein